jgi:hypothetical protein
MGKIKIRNIVILSAVAAVLAITILFSRGPNVSNFLKELILPELSAATGRQVTAGKIYINLFPLFIEARDIRVFEKGNEILYVPRAKGYVGISGLLRKKLVLRRLMLKGPDLKTDSATLEDIIDKVKKYLALERKTPIKVEVRAIFLDEGRFVLGYKEGSFRGSGFSAEAVLNARKNFLIGRRAAPRISFALKELTSTVKGWPRMKSEIKGSFSVKDDSVDIRGLQIGFYGSLINTSGTFFLKKDSSLRVRLGLLTESFRKIFGLKQPGEGNISVKGTVRIVKKDLARSVLDLDLDGSFYVQTLLELLKVTEPVKGLVDFSGSLKGPVNHLAGEAKARLRKGNLYDVQVDDLRCRVRYADGKLDFQEGKAALYNGRAEAKAIVSIVGDGFYSLDVSFSDVDSPPVLDLIGWKPDIPFGKVRGDLHTSGNEFNPSGSFLYESSGPGKDFLGRIRRIKGAYSLSGNVITLSGSSLNTDKSLINFGGDVDINARRLSLTAQLKTSDIVDLTGPDYRDVTGSGEFAGTVKGPFDDPTISGQARMSSVSYVGYWLGEVTATADYRKNLLELRDLSALSGSGSGNSAVVTMKGDIRFPESKELFDFKKHVYNLSVTMKNGDLEKFVRVIYKGTLKQTPHGRFDLVAAITGPGPQPVYKGIGRISSAGVGSLGVDSASFSFSYDYKKFAIEDGLARKGDSTLSGKGSISHDDSFTLKISSGKVYPRDIVSLKGLPPDAYVTFRAEAGGTLDDPSGKLDGVIHGGRLKDTDIGGGKINALIKEKALYVDVTFLDDKVALNGKVILEDRLPWTGRIELKSGRYDYLVAPWLKEVPEDFILSMRGSATVAGDKDHFSAKAVLNQLNTTFYGNSLVNDSDIKFEMADRKVVLSSVGLRSGSGSFKASGNMELGREFNLEVEGVSSLGPLKGLSKRIDTVRGDAGFVFSVTGKWTDPRIDGGLTVTNGVFGVRDLPYRISSLNGYLYMDGNRIVIQKLSGKLAGGDTDISGVALLEGFTLKRFYVNASVTNVGVLISKDFMANFDGSLVYTGTLASQTLSGEVRINRAAYKEPVEWQSWLLKAKAAEKPRGEIGTFEKTNLNVRIQGSDDVIINNNIARASLNVDIVLRGTISDPLIFGRIATKTGFVYFRNNEFRILNASADFADPRRINPTMDITAETTIQGYSIRMVLEGQMDHFTMVLSSTPSLEDADILSLLTVGTLSSEPKGIQGGIGVNAATSFLSGQLQSVAQERLRSLTGIDRIGVEPYYSKATGRSEQRLTVSKRLMGDKLSVTYSTAFGSVATDVIRLEYNIGNNVALIGERDESGGFGGSVKFRFGFK